MVLVSKSQNNIYLSNFNTTAIQNIPCSRPVIKTLGYVLPSGEEKAISIDSRELAGRSDITVIEGDESMIKILKSKEALAVCYCFVGRSWTWLMERISFIFNEL